MKILYAYLSGKGYVQEFAEKLGDTLEDDVTLINLKKEKCPSMEEYDTIIISASIKAGRLPGKIAKFMTKHLTILKSKKILFLYSCMEDKDECHNDYMNNNLSEEIRDVINGSVWIGGRIDFNQYNFFLKTMLKKINNDSTEEIISKENPEAVSQIRDLLRA